MAHPTDVYVGQRLRHNRWILGWSQEQLAEQLGVKFQQIQKYETGANRISASRLFMASKAFGKPIASFFPSEKDLPEPTPITLRDAELLRVFQTLPETQRKAILALAKAVATPEKSVAA